MSRGRKICTDKAEFLAIQCDSHLTGLPPSTLPSLQPIAHAPATHTNNLDGAISLFKTLMASHHLRRKISLESSIFWPLAISAVISTITLTLPPIQSFLPSSSSSACQKHFYIISAFATPSPGRLSPHIHVLCSSTSLSGLLKCHLIRKGFPNHPI